MTVETSRRPRRVPIAEPPRGEISLQSPPVLPRGSSSGAMQLMFFLPMMLGMGAMSFVYIGRSGGAMTYIFGALYLGAMVGMLIMALSRGGAAKKAQINDERRDYLRYLGNLRGQVRKVALAQRAAMAANSPHPADLWTLVGGERMWERRPGDSDYLRVRIGSGPQRLATPLRAPQTVPLEDLDPVCSTSLRHFIRTYSTVADLPVAVSLRSFRRIRIAGERAEALGLARALLSQLATFQSPEDVRIFGCVPESRRNDWDWLKWLPHSLDPQRSDDAGPVRLWAPDLDTLLVVANPEFSGRGPFTRSPRPDSAPPHLAVVVDGADLPADNPLVLGLAGTTVVEIAEPDELPTELPAHVLVLTIAEGRLGTVTADGLAFVGDPDYLDAASTDVLARSLSAHHVGAPTEDGGIQLSATFGLAGLLGIGDPRNVDPAVTWTSRPARARLRLPIGVDPDGRPVELDLKESAEGGMGPHGLVIGATGSGKSELLRTLVTGLAVTHSSETLNLALIDFKGGATFAGMTTLPHTSAVITNLAEDLALVDRMADAIRGELVRRQELLRAAGNFASIRDYQRAREGGADLPPLPWLLVIIDEFSELLSSRGEFIDLFVMIGRLGRSLGIHLLLASQRLEEGRLRGLDSHLSYRIGLRTFSAAESRAVLGVPDAYELPSIPGSAYLKIDTSTLVRFKAAYVSGELPPAVIVDPSAPPPVNRRVRRFTLTPTEPEESTVDPEPTDTAEPVSTGETIMGTMIAALIGKGPAAHQIWLPPLSEPPSIDQLLPPLGADSERGLCPIGWAGNGRLTVPLALVDKPFEQRRDLLWADFSGAAGHAVVVGAPQSGKSTLLRTMAAGLALTHTPVEVQLFMLDFGGGALSALSGLPHVSGCAGRLDAERCRRIVAEVMGLLTERETLFAGEGIDSLATFRSRLDEFGTGADGRRFGDVFLIVDGWMTLRQEYEQLEEAITTLAARGLGFGIHVVLSANRWMEIRPAVRDLIGSQFELKLGDPSDSSIDRRAAMNVPQGAPGRGLTSDKLHFLTALPRIDGGRSAADIAAGAEKLVAEVRAAWSGEPAPAVRLLPRMISVTDLPAQPGRAIPIGIAESDLAPVFVDFDNDPHFLAFGDNESGKTGLLRLLGKGITERYPASDAAIIVADYRRTMLDSIDGDHLLGYAASGPILSGLIADVEKAMRARLPGPDITTEQLRARNWWTGPELFILVDDYDLVASMGRNPLEPLLDFLPQAKDVGLHLVLVRRSGGAGRALYEPVMQRLRELSSPGVMLSGSKDEGVLLGDVKPMTQPPGRGHLVNRRTGSELIQLAWLDPSL